MCQKQVEWGIINDKMSYTHLFAFKAGPKWWRCYSLSYDWHVAKACGLYYRLAQTAIYKRERLSLYREIFSKFKPQQTVIS